MVEKRTGGDRRYAGDEVDIVYNLKRCIHAEYCVKHLSSVFDLQKRPWINANGDTVAAITSVIEHCPSGALNYERKDGVQEATPPKNVIIVRRDGPLEIRGDLEIKSATIESLQETRVSICRCGASNNKPFCDNAHKDIGFKAVEAAAIEKTSEPPQGGKLTVIAQQNGSIALKGQMEIFNEAGELLFSGDETWLCRCGHSSNKPFCDSTHKRVGFVAD